MPTLFRLIAPEPHTDVGDALRSFVFSANLLSQDLSGDTALSTTAEAVAQTLRCSPETATTIYMLSEEDTQPQPAVDPPGFALGFVQISEPLRADTNTLDFQIVLNAELQPLPEEQPDAEAQAIMLQLFDATVAHAKRSGRKILHTWIADEQQHRTMAWLAAMLRDKGFEPKLQETHGWIDVAAVAQPAPLEAPLEAVFIHDFQFPDALIPGVARLLEVADQDVPHGGLSTEPAPWNPERIHSVAQVLRDRGNQSLGVVLLDAQKVIGYSEVVRYSTGEASVAWQGVTVLDEQARGKGLGLKLKTLLFAGVREHLSEVRRVCSEIAIDNHRMFKINQHLGFEPQTTWTALEGRVDYQA
ncbi:hypothetical protein [Corynebacterium pseudopelargi]|uniref:N-acetyltransferase domain-containing protein n=1 Tax=Corynebacterium pseudopelargi TaxID=2080757 RepID=A0A3G6ITV4_9CORY|nr:hypothetical protein [Corynebacterium pseudopelargi]AZA09092.1 hypothetical protein CPPEL_04825 [Corynebacterium pseudopelargi]